MTRSRLVLLTLLLGLSASACAGPRALGGAPDFDVVFAPSAGGALCPVDVVVAEEGRRCQEGLVFRNGVKDCMRATRDETITFTAKVDGRPRRDLEFSLDFDPFRRTSIRSENGVVARPIDRDTPAKAYTFNVFSGRCTPLDPRIIVQ